MNTSDRPPPAGVRREARFGVGVVAATVAVLLGIAVFGEDLTAGSDGDPASSAAAVAAEGIGDDASDGTADTGSTDDEVGDLVGIEAADGAPGGDDELGDLVEADSTDPADFEGCRLEADAVRRGDQGDDVRCVQVALAAAGAYDGEVSGVFDQTTHDAVVALQTDRDMYVDGVVGRETALNLDIWRDEQANVIRTPPPPPGAVDLHGYPLSPVATSGPDAPPLPEGSGTGKRLVYEREGLRVWAVDDSETVIRSWLVTGSKYSNEVPGTHYVYSRSIESTAWNGEARLPKMVRWLQTERGAIGFHGIPTRMDTGAAYQTHDELGTRLSGGCQRQADLDADFVWDFAPEGTKVVVL
ncbi:MAG: L,D-transpeptidase family protein [Ilumatobacteraceae bacterium]